jgi:hypothetical protein
MVVNAEVGRVREHGHWSVVRHGKSKDWYNPRDGIHFGVQHEGLIHYAAVDGAAFVCGRMSAFFGRIVKISGARVQYGSL